MSCLNDVTGEPNKDSNSLNLTHDHDKFRSPHSEQLIQTISLPSEVTSPLCSAHAQRHVSAARRVPPAHRSSANESWSKDFCV